MNYIKHLTGFFEKVVADKTLNPTHISLYIALFQFWNCNRFKNPISISRDEIMRISKISSKATYHKCLRNLHDLNYINYQPSYNPFKGSHVIMFNFSEALKPSTRAERTPLNEPILNTSSEQVVNKQVTNLQTSTEQALVPYINNTNTTNNSKVENSLNASQLTNKLESEEVTSNVTNVTEKEKKLREKKKGELYESEFKSDKREMKSHFNLPGLKPTENNAITNPKMQDVQHYFTQQNFPDIEAQKFYNYFSSIGWLVGGRTPMQNWNAAAENWMLNANKFTKEPGKPLHNANQLNATTNKNYSEPL